MAVPVGAQLACSLAGAIGFVLTIACFFPGYMSPDSVEQLRQGRALSFGAWHPPVMSLLWGLLDRIVPGPAGMLVLHNIIFWIGLSLFVYHLALKPFWAAAAILLIGLSPPVFSLLSTIWKDVSMGSSLLLACGLLLRADRRDSKLAWAMAFPLLWYASAVRHNAIIAVIPLVIWAVLIAGKLFPSKGRRPWLSIAMRASSLVILLGATSAGANKLLSPEPSPFPLQQILAHDLVGVSLETNTLHLPDYLTAELTSRDMIGLQRLYTPNEVVPLFCCDGIGRFELTTDPDKFSHLWTEWRSTIPHHLGAYVRHRTKVFKSEFTIGRNTVCLPFWDGIERNSLNIVFRPTGLNRSVMSILHRVKDGPLFWGWLYLVLLAILLGAFWLGSWPDRVLALLIGLSGVLYGLAYFFVSTTCDFRMHWWTVLTVFLLALIGIASWFNATRVTAHRS